MTERDLTRILYSSVQDVHLSDDARRHIRQMARETEEPIMKKKMTMAIVLTIVMALLTTIGVAAGMGMFDLLEHRMGVRVLPGAQSVANVGMIETDLATFTLCEAAYDGRGASVMVKVTPKDEKTFLLNEGGYLLDDPAFCITGDESQGDITIGEYVKSLGYEQIAEVNATFPNIDTGVSVLDERDGSGLTLIFGFETTGDAVELTFEGMTIPFDAQGQLDLQRGQRTAPFTFAMQAEEPLWTAQVAEPKEFPDAGIRIEAASLTGTRLGTYLYLEMTIMDDHVWEEKQITLTDAEGTYLRPGVTLVGHGEHIQDGKYMSMECTQPMEQAPDRLYLRVYDYQTNTETYIDLPFAK